MIREVEIRDLTERLEAMESKFGAEKLRKNLMEKKMELSDKLNADLKAEYKAQKDIFTLLKGQYKEKVAMLEHELKKSRELSSEDSPSCSASS